MKVTEGEIIKLGGLDFQVIVPHRLREGIVLKRGNLFARLGPKNSTIEEQVHTLSLREQGFPVPKVTESGPHGENWWFFVETSVGEKPYHKIFEEEYQTNGAVSTESFHSYLKIIEKYFLAQASKDNRSSVSSQEFISSMIPAHHLYPNYLYFGFSKDRYDLAVGKAKERLKDAPMGILQFDLNPYNVLSNGIIDFELVGYGPIGYDTLMSARWAGTWFTNYPSRYPLAYSLTKEQLQENDNLMKNVAIASNTPDPNTYLQEFLFLKTAWALSDFDSPQSDWPKDKISFRYFRAKLLDQAITSYLNNESIDYADFSSIEGGEI